MKLPKYMVVTPIRVSPRKPAVKFRVRVKWWGWPVIVFNAMRDHYEIPWYAWIWWYPYLCVRVMVKAMRGGAHGN